MEAFRSRWMDWQGSENPICRTDKTDRSFSESPETLPCRTDKTDKSPSVSFVSPTERSFRQENGRDHCIVLRTELYADEIDSADNVDGRSIVEAVEARGGTLTIERHGITLRWTGHLPDAGLIIDRIRANRIGVVEALRKENRT